MKRRMRKRGKEELEEVRWDDERREKGKERGRGRGRKLREGR